MALHLPPEKFIPQLVRTLVRSFRDTMLYCRTNVQFYLSFIMLVNLDKTWT